MAAFGFRGAFFWRGAVGRRDDFLIDNIIVWLYSSIVMGYVTTNIRFPDDLYKRLKHLAVEKRKSLSFLVRDAVARVYEGRSGSAAEPFDIKKDPFWRFIGCDSGPRDPYGSERDDDIYWREDREENPQITRLARRRSRSAR